MQHGTVDYPFEPWQILISDPDMEVVLLTSSSGVVAYDLPGTANATIQWGTGRGDYQRDGNLSNAIQPSLSGLEITAGQPGAYPGELLTFTITLRNPGRTLNDASMTDVLPPELAYAGNLWASSGMASDSNGTVIWNGAVSSSADVVIRYEGIVDAGISTPTVIINTAVIMDGAGHNWQRQSRVYVFTKSIFLPIVNALEH